MISIRVQNRAPVEVIEVSKMTTFPCLGSPSCRAQTYQLFRSTNYRETYQIALLQMQRRGACANADQCDNCPCKTFIFWREFHSHSRQRAAQLHMMAWLLVQTVIDRWSDPNGLVRLELGNHFSPLGLVIFISGRQVRASVTPIQ